jgi:hypothetical protein
MITIVLGQLHPVPSTQRFDELFSVKKAGDSTDYAGSLTAYNEGTAAARTTTWVVDVTPLGTTSTKEWTFATKDGKWNIAASGSAASNEAAGINPLFKMIFGECFLAAAAAVVRRRKSSPAPAHLHASSQSVQPRALSSHPGPGRLPGARADG